MVAAKVRCYGSSLVFFDWGRTNLKYINIIHKHSDKMKDQKKAIIIVIALFVVAVAIYAFPKASPKTDSTDPEIETWYNGQIFIKEGPTKNDFRTYFQYIISINGVQGVLELHVSSEDAEQWTIITVRNGNTFKMGEETYKLIYAGFDDATVIRLREETA